MASKSPPIARPVRSKAPAKSKARGGLPVVANPYGLMEASPSKTKTSATFAFFKDDYWMATNRGDQEDFEKLLKKYGNSTTWVYIAINRIATTGASVPMQVIRKDREGLPNSVVRVHDRGLLQLLDRPNPYQSQFEFIEHCLVSLEITGNLFIEKVDANGDGRPDELYVINPSRMSIVPGPKSVRAYVYAVNGKQFAFSPDQIIHIKYAHPWNDWYGLAPLTAARLSIDIDQGAMEWNRNFMQKGGWPGGAIVAEGDLDPDSIRRLKKQIKDQISTGKDHAGRVMLLTGGLKYEKLAVTPKEMDWLEARRYSRDEILSIYGVPFAVAGLFSTEQTTARSAGVEQQIKQFYVGTLRPKLRRLHDGLNRDLVPYFGDNFRIIADLRSVPALQDDVGTELQRAQAVRTLILAGFSINEVKARFYPDMMPSPWGDVSWMNSTMMPVKDGNMPDITPPNSGGNGQDPSTNPPKKTTAGAARSRLLERVRARRLALPSSG